MSKSIPNWQKPNQKGEINVKIDVTICSIALRAWKTLLEIFENNVIPTKNFKLYNKSLL